MSSCFGELHSIQSRSSSASYSESQLTDILDQRVKQAFRPGTVADEAIETIVNKVAEENGDCRQALDSLLQAGRKADQGRESKVNAAMVTE
jgi:cell division control protein 6